MKCLTGCRELARQHDFGNRFGRGPSVAISKTRLFVCGFFAVLGIIGIVLPIVPGIPFLIVAVVCWCLGSPAVLSSRPIGLGLVGAILGGIVGYLVRPSALFVGQLPFETVITRGADLRGADTLLVATAQQSFNIMLAAAICGAVAGAVLGRTLVRPSTPSGS